MTRTKEELVTLLEEGNMELFDLIQDLDASQMKVSGVQSFRSIKDILAHITYWNKQGIMWLEFVSKGETPVMPVRGDTLEAFREEMAEINVKVHESNRDRTVDEVLVEYRETFRLVLDEVNRLKQRHLEFVFNIPWAREPVTGRTVVMWRFWHQQNHTKHIVTWLGNQVNTK
jgi:hypothetical protein